MWVVGCGDNRIDVACMNKQLRPRGALDLHVAVYPNWWFSHDRTFRHQARRRRDLACLFLASLPYDIARRGRS